MNGHRGLIEKFNNNKTKVIKDQWEYCNVEWFVVTDELKYAVTEYGEFIHEGAIFATLSPDMTGVYVLRLVDSFMINPNYAICLSHWFKIYSKNLSGENNKIKVGDFSD